MLLALHDGLWFIYNKFLSFQKWEPKFMASQARLANDIIWVRLPELPMEFYDMEFCKKWTLAH